MNFRSIKSRSIKSSNNRPEWVKTLGLIIVPLIILVTQADAQAEQRQRSLQPKQVTSFKQLKHMLSVKKLRPSHYLALNPLSAADSGALFGTGVSEAGVIEHSETNVQVPGVDEGDTVKTDGHYIYSIQNNRIHIIRAYPAPNMALLATLQTDDGFSPIELYIDGDQLLVVGTAWRAEDNGDAAPVPPQNGAAIMPIWGAFGESRTIARIYNIADRSQPVMEREIAFTGDYLSSRKIGESVYLIGRKYPTYYLSYFSGVQAQAQPAMNRDNVLPHISDTAVQGGTEHTLPLTDLYYFPGFVEPDYVVVAGFRLDAPAEDADIKAYLGGGDIVYASGKNLYLSAADYSSPGQTGQAVSAPFTHLYKFALTNGAIDFSNAGEVPGTVLNSFAMDEHDDYFRIATTVDQWTQAGDEGSFQTWNNLYTLDSDMNIAGRLEHLAEGERIYSARFIGNRSYLVTFEQTDPLFVIDLSVPEVPKVLGELKISGFSNYLHPYDETHLLGFGQETQETETGLVTKGMKLALFDVGDVEHPTQMHSLTIGEEGTNSPLMWGDHKALLFDKKRGLLGFPISETAQNPAEEWPTEIFQGAQLYKVSLNGGFVKQAAISHQQAGQTYDWNYYVQRLLTIGNQLYTLSESRLQANDLDAYAQTGFLDLPVEVAPDCLLSQIAEPDGDPVGDCQILIDPAQ